MDNEAMSSELLMKEVLRFVSLSLSEHRDSVFRDARTVDANYAADGTLGSPDHRRELIAFFTYAAKERVAVYITALNQALEMPKVRKALVSTNQTEVMTRFKERLDNEVGLIKGECKRLFEVHSSPGTMVSDATFARFSEIVADGITNASANIEKTQHEVAERSTEKAGKSWWRTQAPSILVTALLTQTGNCGYQAYSKTGDRRFSDQQTVAREVIPVLDSCATMADTVSIIGSDRFYGLPVDTAQLNRIANNIDRLEHRLSLLSNHTDAVFGRLVQDSLDVTRNDMRIAHTYLEMPSLYRDSVKVGLPQYGFHMYRACTGLERQLLGARSDE